MNKAKSIKQIAEELGVSKQKVYRYIKSNCIIEVHRMHDTMYYDDVAETCIKRHFQEDTASDEAHHDAVNDAVEAHHDTVRDAVSDTVLDMFRIELEIKNRQIEALNEQLKDVTSALLASQQTAVNAQALHAGTIKEHLAEPDTTPEPDKPSVRKGFFSRLFKLR